MVLAVSVCVDIRLVVSSAASVVLFLGLEKSCRGQGLVNLSCILAGCETNVLVSSFAHVSVALHH